MDTSSAIDIRDLRLEFDGRSVLRDFSIRVEFGEKVHLTGRSGSGKSTVLRCVLGFVTPDSGTVRVGGDEITPGSVWSLRRKMAYVAQEPELGDGSVDEVLARPFEYRANVDLRGNLDRIEGLLDRFLLPKSLLKKDIKSVSSGEKQRVALIGALLLDRDIMLLDEPASALDGDAARAVALYLAEQTGLTVVCASHGMGRLPLEGRTVELPGGSVAGDVE